jgi:hypothetical protein
MSNVKTGDLAIAVGKPANFADHPLSAYGKTCVVGESVPAGTVIQVKSGPMYLKSARWVCTFPSDVLTSKNRRTGVETISRISYIPDWALRKIGGPDVKVDEETNLEVPA